MSQNVIYRSLAAPVRWTSFFSGRALRTAKALRCPRILMYHVIGDGDVSPAQFAWHLQFLRMHFEPVGLGTLVDRLANGDATGREVAITFDDGVQNHYRVAWPLLRAADVPATFFVCPGLIESRAWMWRTELRKRLQTLDHPARASVAARIGSPDEGVEAIMQWAKRLPMGERDSLQRDVWARTPAFSPSAKDIDDNTPLTWEQIREMDGRVITIGSHTSTHPVLPTLQDGQLEAEIAGSRQMLEQKLDRNVDLFSYPNGENSAAVIDVVRRHYRAAVVARQAVVSAKDDLMMLPRVPGGGPRATFVRRMHRPSA